MSKWLEEDESLLLIFNLNSTLRSSDLRGVFASYIERGDFLCFHYRHRSCNQELSSDYKIEVQFSENSKFCFFIAKKSASKAFIDEFNGMSLIGAKLGITCINELVETIDSELRERLFSLSEFNPPSYLPMGNVGTPKSVCLDMITQCRMPTSVLKSLKLDTTQSFTNVSFNYNLLGETRLNEFSPQSSDCEDWERHIQLHDDVDNQQRTAERTYESEKEIVWEKGSSGLVHYTDALYWNEKAGKNVFDEDAVDDWDVDMAVYTDPACADRDARELLLMREIECAKRGVGHELSRKKDKRVKKQKQRLFYAEFERFTKGFGSQQLAKYGWVRGKPISRGGLIEPLESLSRESRDKSGLGYFARPQTVARSSQENSDSAKISTIFDPINEEVDTALQSAESTMMKYRKTPMHPKKP